MSILPRPIGRTAVLMLFAAAMSTTGTWAQDAGAPEPGAGGQPAPVAAATTAAQAVLDRHCARCHQAGRTPDGEVKGGLGAILDLDGLVAGGRWVRAGLPEASAIFNTAYSGHAPLGVLALAEGGAPTVSEIAALRAWIERIGPPAPQQPARPGATADSTDGAARSPSMTLALHTDAEAFKVGQTVTVFAQASHDCHLTLINVDTRGIATVLLPNEYEPDNTVKAGQRIAVPSQTAPYRLRFTQPGRETLVGICTRTARPIDTIRHNFERQHFTVLGNWQSFQLRAYEEAGKPPAAPRQRKAPRRRGTREPDNVLPETRGLEPQARAAISIEVQ